MFQPFVKRDGPVDLANICRICLNDDQTLGQLNSDAEPPHWVDLFDNPSEQCSLPMRFMSCLALEINPSDALPKRICSPCRRQLERSFWFRRKAQNSDSMLRRHLRLSNAGKTSRVFEESDDEHEPDYDESRRLIDAWHEGDAQQKRTVERTAAEERQRLTEQLAEAQRTNDELHRFTAAAVAAERRRQQRQAKSQLEAVEGQVEQRLRTEIERSVREDVQRRFMTMWDSPATKDPVVAVVDPLAGAVKSDVGRGQPPPNYGSEFDEEVDEDDDEEDGTEVVNNNDGDADDEDNYVMSFELSDAKPSYDEQSTADDGGEYLLEEDRLDEDEEDDADGEHADEQNGTTSPMAVVDFSGGEESAGKNTATGSSGAGDSQLFDIVEYVHGDLDEDDPDYLPPGDVPKAQTRSLKRRAPDDDESTCVETVHSHSQRLLDQANADATPKSYACELCDLTFDRRLLLARHQTARHQMAPGNVCELCDRSFNTASSLVRHMRVHTGERPFMCDICDRRFIQKEILKRHMRTHTGERPYACTQCDRAFTQHDLLKQHVRRVHSEQPVVELHRCSVCPKSFLHASGLSRHLTKHIGRVYRCPQCEKSFNDASAMRRHLTTVHAEQLAITIEANCTT